MAFWTDFQRGLKRFIDPAAMPAAAPPVAHVVGPAPLAAVTGRWQPNYIAARVFTPANQVLDRWSTLSYLKVEPETIYGLPAGKPYRLYLRALGAFAGLSATAATATTHVVTGIVQTPRATPVLPALYVPDVSVWCEVASVWSQVAVASIDYATGTIGYTEPVNCTNVNIYYTHGVGDWRITAKRVQGAANEQTTTLLNGSINGINTTDQDNTRTIPRLPHAIQLVEGFDLMLQVKSTLPMTWQTGANPDPGQVLFLYSLVNRITTPAANKVHLQELVQASLESGM